MTWDLLPLLNVGVAGAMLVLFATGRINSRRELDDVRRDCERRVESAERREEIWRTAYLAAEERGRVRDDQVGELLEMGRTMTDVWKAVERIAARGGGPP